MSKRFIISASRRTDILAFPTYVDWFMDKLERGGCYVRNPIVAKPYYVSLLTEDVYGFVFWTKNPKPVMSRLDKIDRFGRPVVFFLTITGYGVPWEPNIPGTGAALEMAKALAERYGWDHIWWRYDPVIITEQRDERFHVENFTRLAEAMQGTRRCVMSKDIGNFDTCYNDCLYCFANRQIDKEASVVVRIEPKSVWLWPEPLEMPIPPK